MLPYLSLFGRLMPTYGVLGMAGLGFGLLAALLRCKRFGLSRDDCAYLYILGAVGGPPLSPPPNPAPPPSRSERMQGLCTNPRAR